MIADISSDTTAVTILITTLSGACTGLVGTVAYLFKLLIAEKDARIKAASDIKGDDKP